MLQASFENKTRGNRLREKKKLLYPAKNFTFKTAVIVVKHHSRQLEKNKILLCMTQGNLNATQTSANEQAKNVWAHTRACIPLSCACMGKKGAIEWVHALFLLGFTYWADKQSIPIKASCRPGVCRKGAVLHWITSSFLTKKKKNNPPTLADCDRRGAAVLQEQIQREAWRCTERAAGRFQPGPQKNAPVKTARDRGRRGEDCGVWDTDCVWGWWVGAN